MRKTLVIFSLVFVTMFILVATAAASSDPTQSVDRVKVVVTTTSKWSRLTVPSGASILNSKGGLIAGGATVATVDGSSVFIDENVVGSTSTVQFDVLVTADNPTNNQWKLEKGWGQTTHVDIYNDNDSANPVLIASQDNLSPGGDAVTFNVDWQLLSQGGPLTAGNMGPKLVLACYVPWWTYTSWDNPPHTDKIDKPTVPYSVWVQSDVQNIVASAANNGIDGFAASFQGMDRDGPAFQTLFSVTDQRRDFKVAAYMETAVANAGHSESESTDPAYLRQWITDVVRNYGSSPSYLKVNGKPVIFFYRARNLTPSVWKNEVFDPLRAQGIDAFYIADYVKADGVAPMTDYLEVFDGMHSFNPSVYQANIPYQLSTNSLATKTYSLLNEQTPRKLWMGTAVPGFDATRLRPQSIYVPRDNGNFYRSIWNTNLATNPDWMMITTWNDYGENTHIESSQTYGNTYLDLTKTYSDQFKIGGQAVPSLTLTATDSYWASFQDYTARQLTVDYRVNNTGGNASGLKLTRLSATNGVAPLSQTPYVVGDVNAGGSARFAVRWQVPENVGSFLSALWGEAVAADGSTVFYPSPPPG